MPLAQSVTIKVAYKEDVCRVGRAYFNEDNDWISFCVCLRKLFHEEFVGIEDGSFYQVSYIDDEGDKIVVSSTNELREAFKVQKKFVKFTIDETFTAFSRCNASSLRRPIQASKTTRANEQSQNSIWRWDTNPESAAPHVHENIAMPPVNPTADPAVNISDEVSKICSLVRNQEFETAHELCLEGLHNYPTSALLWYNLACVEALRGHRWEALVSMRAAARYGYNDWQYVQQDEDLSDLKGMPEFDEIIRIMKGESVDVENGSFSGVADTSMTDTMPSSPLLDGGVRLTPRQDEEDDGCGAILEAALNEAIIGAATTPQESQKNTSEPKDQNEGNTATANLALAPPSRPWVEEVFDVASNIFENMHIKYQAQQQTQAQSNVVTPAPTTSVGRSPQSLGGDNFMFRSRGSIQPYGTRAKNPTTTKRDDDVIPAQANDKSKAIQTFVEMGFEKEIVEVVLVACQWNVDEATRVLMQG